MQQTVRGLPNDIGDVAQLGRPAGLALGALTVCNRRQRGRRDAPGDRCARDA